MGYGCPICGEVHPDGTHLAHHVAVAASLDREDHQSWLAEYAPNWESMGPEELAPIVTERAESIETRELEDPPVTSPSPASLEHLSGDVEAILEEARTLTSHMYGLTDDDEES